VEIAVLIVRLQFSKGDFLDVLRRSLTVWEVINSDFHCSSNKLEMEIAIRRPGQAEIVSPFSRSSRGSLLLFFRLTVPSRTVNHSLRTIDAVDVDQKWE
jgi:hypothetical protein